MPDVRVDAGRGQRVLALRLIEHVPAGREEDEAAANESEACQMERAGVGIGAPAKHHFQQVTRVMRKPVHVGITTLKPA